MQMLTFTQKLFRQQRFFNCLIPLLALFVGLGAPQTVFAGVTAPINPTLLVDQNSASGTNTTYSAAAFDGTDLGTYDINTGKLLLNGGSFSTQEKADANYTYAVTGAFIEFAVYKTIGGTLGAFTRLALNQTSGPDANGIRVFSLTTAQQNLIRQAVVNAGGVAPGTVYNVFTQFGGSIVRTKISDGTTAVSSYLDNNGGYGYTAHFQVTGTYTAPTNVSNTSVVLDTTQVSTSLPQNGNPNINENMNYGLNSGQPPLFSGATLGGAQGYDINTGQLYLNGGRATTFESNGDTVTGVTLYYRVFKSGANVTPVFNAIALQGGGTATNGTRTFATTTAQANLIAGIVNSGIGTYLVQVYTETSVKRAGGNVTVITDNNNSNFYTASFKTKGVPIKTTTWTGNYSDDWFDKRNWDLGVPDAGTNALIPDFGPGLSIYPNIYSNDTYTATLRDGSKVVVDNTKSGPALCRSLVLNGGSQALRSICRLYTGTLKVYGDFVNQQDSFIQRENTILEFAGVNQAITGGSSFKAVVISGGGTKRLIGSMFIEQSMTFNGGIVTTDIGDPTRSFIELSGRTALNNNNGAQLINETDLSYIRGFVRTTRNGVTANELDPKTGKPDPRTFGNMGLTLFFYGANNPGDVLVTRNTAENYTPLLTKYSIRRIFGVRPSSPNTNNGGLIADMTFGYLDSETKNLGPNGTGSIREQDLALFVSTNSGNTFGYLGRDGAVNTGQNIVTKSGVRTFATFTLGDINNPLPVRLTAFDAKRVGADALVTWQTATEENSKGYDVQVSTDGKVFRTLASVPSANPNTMKLTSYSYLDTEKNKAGTRYYRLRQVDLDGKETFFAPVAVSFEGKVAETTLVAYPNPFNGFDQLHVALTSTAGGQGQLRITDMSGRAIRQERVELNSGLTDLSVNGLSDLKAGIYIVNLTLPTGEVKNLKIVKQ